jgi:hypothetical protein
MNIIRHEASGYENKSQPESPPSSKSQDIAQNTRLKSLPVS